MARQSSLNAYGAEPPQAVVERIQRQARHVLRARGVEVSVDA